MLKYVIMILLTIAITYPSVIFNHNGFGNGWYIKDKIFLTNTHIADKLIDYFYVFDNKKNYFATIEEIYDLGDDISLIKIKENLPLTKVEVAQFKNQVILDVKGHYYFQEFSYPLAYFRIDYNPLTNEVSNSWISWFGVSTFGYSGSGIFWNGKLVGIISCMNLNTSQIFATMIVGDKYGRITTFK